MDYNGATRGTILSHKRKRPGRYQQGEAAPEYHSDAKIHYRQIYYDFLDRLMMGETDCFDQPGYAIYEELHHDLLLEATKNPANVQGTDDTPTNVQGTDDTLDDNVKRVLKIYEDDIDMPRLRDQIIMPRSILPLLSLVIID